MKPRIAIPHPKSEASYTERVLPQYAHAVEVAGGEPVPIPLNATSAQIAQLAKRCHGVLLPGSPADVDPQKYGAATRHPETAPADPARDNVDELLLQDAYNMHKPILGICYGVQSLNVWRNGTLLQHISSSVKHTRLEGEPSGTVVEHAAKIEPDSMLAKILGDANQTASPLEVVVNSSHHQSVEKAGDGLRIVARSPLDGVIEAVEGTNPEHWVLGVQWHPERNVDENSTSKALLCAFIEAVKRWQETAAVNGADFENAAL